MYALQDTNSLWSMPSRSATQGYYGGMPTLVFAAQPTVNQTHQPMFYQIQPALYAPIRCNNQHRPRLSSDDVFIPEGAVLYNVPMYNFHPDTQNINQNTVILNQIGKETRYQDGRSSKASSLCSQPSSSGSRPSSNSSSPNSGSSGHNSSSESLRNPRKLQIGNSFSVTSNSNSASSSPNKHENEDLLPETLFTASLYAAINADSEPTIVDLPLRTSSPIRRKSENKSLLIDFSNLRKRRGREITSSSSEKCPRFSENGVCEDLDQCDRILIRSRERDVAEEAAKRREEFLLVLEAERERQKKTILSKTAPKMSCKFCQNNGESADVFTKHRLHYNEKTVCPILRHYVCRLCNSTGDFAHTIRHCPFNDKKDKIAWKATFLA